MIASSEARPEVGSLPSAILTASSFELRPRVLDLVHEHRGDALGERRVKRAFLPDDTAPLGQLCRRDRHDR